jgi:hypothetical protein
MGEIYEGPLFETFGAKGGMNSRLLKVEEPTELPFDELHDGLHLVEIHLYGDSPEVPFVHVIATTQERADAIFKRVMEAFTSEHIGEMLDG